MSSVFAASRAALACAAAVFLAACGDSTSPPVASRVAVFSGSAQTGVVGAPLANPIVVRVTDANGTAVRGAQVRWVVTAGGGSVQPAESQTDGSGLAEATWTLGGVVGSSHALQASIGNDSVTITASGHAGTVAASLTASADTTFVDDIGLSAQLGVVAKDAFGNTVNPGQFTWTSLDPGVATIVGSGASASVTGQAVGSARIVAAADSAADTVLVIVRQLPGTVTITSPTSGYVGSSTDTLAGHASATSVNGHPITGGRYVWTSSDTTVARIVNDSVIVGVARGVTELEATLSGVASPPINYFVFTSLTTATRLSVGSDHACVVLADGSARCWGAPSGGQIGAGGDPKFAQLVTGVPALARITAGTGDRYEAPWPYTFAHTCALTTDGVAYCWGIDRDGQVGSDAAGLSTCRLSINRIYRCYLSAVPVTTTLRFADIVAGGNHTCALTSSGAAYCWGRATQGQLGTTDSLQTCYLEDDAQGPTPEACATAPVAVAGGLTFSSLTAGNTHTCGISAGAAYCWGDNSTGALGDGTTTSSTTPVPVTGGYSFVQLAAGDGFTCGVTNAGTLRCWGNNQDGRTGYGVTSGSTLVPTAVYGGATYTAVTAGVAHACALRPGGLADCWGENTYGQLGTSATSFSVPHSTFGVGITAIDGGYRHTCVIRTDQRVACWGLNDRGQLGNGTNTVWNGQPVTVVLP